ncbi:MAG: putative toxin-antitoxin system toxin component, PIN family [Coleofasciculus sp. G3-WIS-01]
MRVVFDTNTVLSALVFKKGRLSWMRQVWSQQWAIPLISEVTEGEIRRVLNYPKFKLSHSEQQILLDEYLPFCERVEIPEPLPVVPDCRDPKDVPFLWLATVGHAEYLVTGDRDLLALVDVFPVPIITGDVFQGYFDI